MRAYKKGRCCVSPDLVTYITENKKNNLQIGVTTAKKVGNAVRRSRSRRVIRAAYTSLCPQIKKGYNIVFVARTATAERKSYEIERTMRSHLKKAGILKGSVK